MEDDLIFTVVNPYSEEESVLNISYRKEGPDCEISHTSIVPEHPVTQIDPQQLAELGTLFLAIAAKLDPNVDLDSCLELLDGYRIPVPEKQLQELVNSNQEERKCPKCNSKDVVVPDFSERDDEYLCQRCERVFYECCCPKCKSTNVSGVNDWHAEPLDEGSADPCDLTELQCKDCGQAFWM